MISYIKAAENTFAERGDILDVWRWLEPPLHSYVKATPVVRLKDGHLIHLGPREWEHISPLELLAKQAE